MLIVVPLILLRRIEIVLSPVVSSRSDSDEKEHYYGGDYYGGDYYDGETGPRVVKSVFTTSGAITRV